MGKNVPAAAKRKLFVDGVAETQRLLSEFEHAKVAGLDPSLAATSIVVHDGMNDVFYMSTSPEWIRTDPSKLKRYKRVEGTQVYVRGILKRHKPTLLAMEDYSYGSPGLLTVLAEVGGIIRMSLWELDMPHFALMVTPSQLKKYILGTAKGETTKDMITMAVYKNYGVEPRNNNESDAAVLCVIARDLVIHIDAIHELVKNCGDDKAVRQLMDNGHKELGIAKHRWEVLRSLLTERCGKTLLQYVRD